MTIGLLHYLTLGAILFGIGLYGVYNQDIAAAKEQYATLGYECE